MRKPLKRTIAALLVLAVAVTAVFASPLKPGHGFGDAKVYDDSYKSLPSATEVSEGFVIRTANDSVALDNGSTHVELDSNSLAVFVSLDDELEIYILDGRILVSSTSGDFTIMTTVTTYNVKSGSSIYVITDASDEIGFVSEGSAVAHNFIMGTSTEIGCGNYIDNSINGFPPSQSSVASIWGEEKKEQSESVKEPEAEKSVLSPITASINYGNIHAAITAYQGYAELDYPTFVTDEELIAAAAAAAAAYPQYMDGIYYQITGRGRAALYYPENYGEKEFELAMHLLDAELPAYIASLTAEPAAQAAVATAETPVEETRQEPETPEPEPQSEPEPEAQPETTEQTQPEKTPLETIPRPEQTQPEPEKKSDFSFGLWAGGLYGKGVDGNEFSEFHYTDGRLGTFWKNYSFFLRPYIKYKGFLFGLNAEAHFIDNTFQLDPYKFDTENGVTGYINSVAKYISVLGYESESFTLKFSLKDGLQFTSPIFKSFDRLYAKDENLVGKLSLKAGFFNLDAFVDDMKLSSKLAGGSQFAGFRAGFTFGSLNLGIGAAADFGKGLKESLIYPSADLNIPFELAGTRLKLSVQGAAQIGFTEGFKLYGILGKAIIGIGYGPMDIEFGAAYNKDRHFSDLMTNAPVSTFSFNEGTSFDAIASIKLDTKVFGLKASLNIPISMEGGRFANTIMTRSGSTVESSADVFDFQTDIKIGSFTFTIGSSIYGFAGKVSDLINAAADEDARNAAIKNLISPETSTIFAKLDFNTPVGPGDLDVFARLDLMEIGGILRLPLSIGASYSF